MLPNEWLAAFAPIGTTQTTNRWTAVGACVFIHKHPLVWTVTAAHVIDKIGPSAVSILVTPTPGQVNIVEIGRVISGIGVSWVRDHANDIAAAPTPSPDKLGLKAIPTEFLLRLTDVIPSMPCFTVGCPYGLHGVDPLSSTPLVLDGVISGVNSVGKRIYTSAPTFRGNSGGPLLVFRSPINPAGGLKVSRRPTTVLGGIMLETSFVFSPDASDRTPPLHLGVAAPMDAVIDLLDSEAAKTIVAKVSTMQA
jgi:hypothetical protein